MIRVVYITWFINTMNTILRHIAFRLGTKRINPGYIIHMLCIMMNQISMYMVIAHTIYCLRPSPTKADTTIRNFTNLVMLYMYIPHVSCRNSETSPVFITNFCKIAIIDLLICAYFPTVSRFIRQMCFMGSRRKTAD